MLAEFLSWWTAQITDLARHGLRAAGTAASGLRQPDALLVRVTSPTELPGIGEIELVRRRGGVLTPLGRFALDGAGAEAARRVRAGQGQRLPLVLSLAAQPLLAREVVLPLAAEQGLQTALRFEMDRLTPFRPEEVWWDCTRLRRDRGRGVLVVDMTLVPRTAVGKPLDALGQAGLVPVALEGLLPDGRPRRIALDQADPARAARTRRLLLLAGGVCAALAVTVVAVPVLRQSLALQEAEDEIAALRPRMAAVEALRRRLAGDGGAGAPAAARARAGDTLQALATLTDLLPDNTSLTSLSLHHGRLRMEGVSAVATHLIGALSDEPRIRNPGFAAPVVRGDDGGDVFAIEAEFAR